MIRFHLLGGPELRDEAGNELRALLAQPKRLALLAYLALEAPNGFCRRDSLLALFWPEVDEERARLALRQALYFLRRTIGATAVIGRGDEEVGVAADVVWCDAVAFEGLAEQGRAADALDLYRGDLLPGFFIADAAQEFEQWLEEQRTRLRSQAAAAAWLLAEAAEQAGNAVEASAHGRDAVRLSPHDETGVRRLIALLDRVGDRSGALRTYDAFAQSLQQEFGLEPSAETRSVIDCVRSRNESVAAARALPVALSADHAAEPTIAPAATRKRTRRRMVTAAIAATAVLGVAALVARGSGDIPLLAMGWVENKAGPESYESARLLPGLLATDLAQVPGLAVVSDARLYEALSELDAKPENAQVFTDAARRAGADEMLQGVLYRLQSGFRLDLHRIDLASGVVREAYTVEGADAFELTERAAATIARAFSVKVPSAPLLESTRSLAARSLYEEGLRAYYRGGGFAGHDFFAAAFREDSTFAIAAYYAGATRNYDDSARVYYERATRLAERAPERDRLWIKMFTQRSDRATALAVAETLADRFPNEPHGHIALGNFRFDSGDFLEAIPYAQKVLDMDSLSLTGKTALCRACEAYALMNSAYVSADSPQAAERIVREWIRRRPASSGAWTTLASTLAHLGHREQALAAAQHAEKLQPGARANLVYAWIAILSDDFAEADRLLRQRLQYDASDGEAIWYLGISLRNQGRLDEAHALARRAVAINPDFLFKLFLAQSLFEMGRFHDAATQFEMVAHSPSGYTPPLLTKGTNARHLSWFHTLTATALAAAGDSTRLQSLADTIAAVAHLSSYGRDWHLADHVRGLAWLARRQPLRAEQSLRAAIYSPGFGYSRTNVELARLFNAQGRPAEAIAILQPTLRGHIESSGYYATRTELHELLARSFQLANQPDSAAAHYRMVARAWANGDPPYRARAEAARNHLAALKSARPKTRQPAPASSH